MLHNDAPTIGFVLEQTLGHVTHAKNLRDIISGSRDLRPVWRPIAWEIDGLAAKVPGYGNWTVRSGLRARRAIAGMDRTAGLDAVFIHTQVPAVLAGRWVGRIPTVVSVDATPLQYDELGAYYRHERSSPPVEHLKWLANRRCFDRAVHLVSWSHWAKAGLVDGYGVPADKVTVIPPGVHAAGWAPPADGGGRGDGPVRILFVGGDLDRKGGWVLLDAFRRLREDLVGTDVELHLVTPSDVPMADGVVVHRRMTPNSPELKALYHRADVFCLPTRGDCLPMVLSEAGAAELPLVSTRVGAIPEIVRHGETGFVVEQDDAVGLAKALAGLVTDREMRRRQGAAAAAVVRADFDAVANADRLVAVLVRAAGAGRPARHATTRRRRPGRGPLQPRGRDVLLTVSGVVPADVAADVEAGTRPRPDYVVMAEAFGADLIDHADADRLGGPIGNVVRWLAGPHSSLAWTCFRLRHRYDVVFTDGEQVGLPYALLCRLARWRGRARDPRHVMIVHIMSVRAKAALFRTFRLGGAIDTMVVYATAQQRYLRDALGVPESKVVPSPFMVDTAFFSPTAVTPSRARPTICSAGLEHRDYPTMIEAVRGLDVDVVLAAASPWSKRNDTTHGQALPDNVEVCRLDFVALRQLYADSLFVVMPLEDVPFQAGVTTILEAMAMGRAVICSRTEGQTDVIVDGETGLYVPPGDPGALRAAIRSLLDDPPRARRMGEAARRWVLDADVARYAARLRALVR